jgi:hypothetical protein
LTVKFVSSPTSTINNVTGFGLEIICNEWVLIGSMITNTGLLFRFASYSCELWDFIFGDIWDFLWEGFNSNNRINSVDATSDGRGLMEFFIGREVNRLIFMNGIFIFIFKSAGTSIDI